MDLFCVSEVTFREDLGNPFAFCFFNLGYPMAVCLEVGGTVLIMIIIIIKIIYNYL